MPQKYILMQENANGVEIHKEIRELDDDELGGYREIGEKVIGNNIKHCISIVMNHIDNFWGRVLGFQVLENDKEAEMFAEEVKDENLPNKDYIAVQFFEKNDTEQNNNKILTEDQIRQLWYLYVSEQLEEELSNDDIEQINDYIRKSGDDELWEI